MYSNSGLEIDTFVVLYEKLEKNISNYMFEQMKKGNNPNIQEYRKEQWNIMLRYYKIKKIKSLIK